MTPWHAIQNENLKEITRRETDTRRRMAAWYDQEAGRLAREIASYYTRYGINNVIEYRQLLLQAPPDQVAELRVRFRRFCEAHPELEHLIPVSESLYRLTRLEGLQRSILLQQYEIGAIEEKTLTAHLKGIQALGYDAATGYLGATVDKYIVKDFVNTRWADGLRFSDRIWRNKEKLYRHLSEQLSAGLARGDSYQKLARQMKKEFTTQSVMQVERLVYTESTRVYAEATAEPFRQAGIIQYTFSDVGDSKVCPICKEIHDKVFTYDQRQAGVNFPPMHPWCRCTTSPYVADWDAFLKKG